jgi:hypothetical protein
MATHRLPTVEPLRSFPATARVVILTHPGPVTCGDGSEDYVCAKCWNVLLEHVRRGYMGSPHDLLKTARQRAMQFAVAFRRDFERGL